MGGSYVEKPVGILPAASVAGSFFYYGLSQAHADDGTEWTIGVPRTIAHAFINMVPGAIKILVESRAEILGALPANPELTEVDADFVHLLGLAIEGAITHGKRAGYKNDQRQVCASASAKRGGDFELTRT